MKRVLTILIVLLSALPAFAASAGGDTFLGLPGWIFRLLNLTLFIVVLVWLIGGPIKRGLAARRDQIRREAEEARARREKADQIAGDIQHRLSQIEADVRAIHEKAQAEGERQKREMIASAETEAAKMLQAARVEVESRIKSARAELTQYAGELAANRAETILRERITSADQQKLFKESLAEVGEVQS